MFRPSGECVLIDFGLSHHNLLPDLLQEEFRLPYGTAPYMAPERLLGVRDDPRSDLFSLGVLLYFFTTGERPFGESETLRGMRRRLWRDPHPPRKLRPDYPPWLQEIVLRCLEIEPVWRYPTAVQGFAVFFVAFRFCKSADIEPVADGHFRFLAEFVGFQFAPDRY